MPKKSRSKKKVRKVVKKKGKKVKKVRKIKNVKKVKKGKKAKKVQKAKKAKKVRKVKVAKKKMTAAKKKLVKKIAEKVIGKVTHYYDRIGVAVVEVQLPIRIGDTIRLRHGRHEFTQTVQSLQVNHTPIAVAAKGQEVGMKVNEVASEGTLILPA